MNVWYNVCMCVGPGKAVHPNTAPNSSKCQTKARTFWGTETGVATKRPTNQGNEWIQKIKERVTKYITSPPPLSFPLLQDTGSLKSDAVDERDGRKGPTSGPRSRSLQFLPILSITEIHPTCPKDCSSCYSPVYHRTSSSAAPARHTRHIHRR